MIGGRVEQRGEQILAKAGTTPVLEQVKDLQIKQVVRVRRDIWKLETAQQWRPMINAYAEAVRIMKTRPRRAIPPAGPTRRQSTATPGPTPGATPANTPAGSSFPGAACTSTGSSASAGLRSSPAPTLTRRPRPTGRSRTGTTTGAPPPTGFRRDVTTPGGDPNPLFVSGRSPSMAAGGGTPSSVTSAVAALAKHNFTGGSGGPATTGGFGGPLPASTTAAAPSVSWRTCPNGAVHGERPVPRMRTVSAGFRTTTSSTGPRTGPPTRRTWCCSAGTHHEGGWKLRGDPNEWLDSISPTGHTLTSLPPPPLDLELRDRLFGTFSGDPPESDTG